MNLNPLPWLRGCVVRSELSKWKAAGLLHAEQEQRIADQYDHQCCGIPVDDCAKLTFFALSAIAMLLALLLIVADHWREIYLPLKICVALIGMSLAHGAGYWYRFQVGQERHGEVCFFTGTVLYGCVMLLAVDQYYAGLAQRSIYLGWVFFAWTAGTLPLAWLLGSRSMLALASVLGTIWVVWHIAAAGTAKPTWLFLAQELCLLRWAYTNRSRSLFALTLVGFVAWWCMLAVAEGWGREAFFWIATAGPLLLLIGLRHDETHSFAVIYRNLGIALNVLMLLVLSLPSVSRELIESGHMLRICLAVLAGVGALIVLVPAARRIDYLHEWPGIAALACVTLLPVLVGTTGYSQGLTTGATIALAAVYNAVSVTLVVWLLLYGAWRSRSECVAAAIVYFALWVTLVTIDLADSLTPAALIFAVAGAALLGIARLQWRKQASVYETVSSENV